MQGYTLITSEDEELGEVVATVGDNLIVEHGTVFKKRHAVPNAFAEVSDDERVVRTTLSKTIIEDSPDVDGEELDARAVAYYYGLAEGDVDPATEGYGVLEGDETSMTADQEALRRGMEPAERQRARIRENLGAGQTYGPPGRQIIPPNPHEVGGREVDSS